MTQTMAVADPNPAAPARLAILIPTYSRARHLERLLRALAADPALADGRCPVLVADNDSSDDTVATSRALMTEFPGLDLRLHKQTSNIGPVANMRWLIEHAPAADYLWLFGDDDLPLPGTVESVLAATEHEFPSLIHLPSRWETEDGVPAGSTPCPESVERYPGSRSLLFTTYCLHFVSATVAEQNSLREAVRLAPTDNDWAPYIWFAIAGRRGPCVVLPHIGVSGGVDSGWLPRRATVLTRRVVEAFEDGLRLVVDNAGFARILDVRYGPGLGSDQDYWMIAPVDDLASAVSQFPSSRELRRLLVNRGRRDGSMELIELAAEAARRCGAADRALAHVSEGEACFGRGDARAAEEHFRLALAEDGTNATAWCNLGVVLDATGTEPAGMAFDAALSVDPDNVDALVNRALWHLAAGQPVAAAHDARRLAEVAPGHPGTAQAMQALDQLDCRPA